MALSIPCLHQSIAISIRWNLIFQEVVGGVTLRTYGDVHNVRTGSRVFYSVEILNGSNIEMLVDYDDVTMETESLVYDPVMPFAEQDTVNWFDHT